MELKSGIVVAACALAWVTAGCGGDEWRAPEASQEERVAGIKAATQEDAEEREREISLDDLSDIVRRAALQAAGGAEIQEVEEVQMDAGLVYEVEWTEGGHEIEITLTSDGAIIHRIQEPVGSVEEADVDD